MDIEANSAFEKHEIVFLEQERIFTIRIFGVPDEQDIVRCFQDYERIVEDRLDNRQFSFIINVTEEAHSSIAVVRLIRLFLENQKYRRFIQKIAAVNDNEAKVNYRNSHVTSRRLPFFHTEQDAIAYILRLE